MHACPPPRLDVPRGGVEVGDREGGSTVSVGWATLASLAACADGEVDGGDGLPMLSHDGKARVSRYDMERLKSGSGITG